MRNHNIMRGGTANDTTAAPTAGATKPVVLGFWASCSFSA